MVQMFGRWSADELRAAADIAKEKGVGVRLQADGSISIGIVPPSIASATIGGPGSKSPGMPNVFSPATLAQRWLCSEKHIRNMIENGQLEHFHLGGKLLRISVDEVERVENTAFNAHEAPDLGGSDELPPPHGSPPQRERAKRLDEPLTRARLKRLRRQAFDDN